MVVVSVGAGVVWSGVGTLVVARAGGGDLQEVSQGNRTPATIKAIHAAPIRLPAILRLMLIGDPL